eukprot:COSAG05_NODE_1671_length_4303_cov_2.550666_4_plen_42_part_00
MTMYVCCVRMYSIHVVCTMHWMPVERQLSVDRLTFHLGVRS